MMYILKGIKFIQFIGLYLILGIIIPAEAQIKPGIESVGEYLPDLQGKRVVVVANQTSLKGEQHLVDFLLEQEINVKMVFAPEHGFRGKADAGAHVKDGVDAKTGLPIISLYGKNKKPQADQLADIDVVIFDIQDVGARFYTYISTMSLVMEACAELGIPVIVLDRPNPNGYYIDGPVLKEGFESFVGMHPVPIVYGMTIGEYAQMVNGEGWLKDGVKCFLKVVRAKGYDHNKRYALPIKPSPNLPNDLSIQLYPSLCLFEGTKISAGRGTDYPFQLFGAPWLTDYKYSFTPQANSGSQYPKFKNTKCYGYHFTAINANDTGGRINLSWLLESRRQSADEGKFFNSFFDKLAGTDSLRIMIESRKTEEEIVASWQPDLEAFKQIRKKYLLYPDFY